MSVGHHKQTRRVPSHFSRRRYYLQAGRRAAAVGSKRRGRGGGARARFLHRGGRLSLCLRRTADDAFRPSSRVPGAAPFARLLLIPREGTFTAASSSTISSCRVAVAGMSRTRSRLRLGAAAGVVASRLRTVLIMILRRTKILRSHGW